MDYINSKECRENIMPNYADFVIIGFGANDAAYGI